MFSTQKKFIYFFESKLQHRRKNARFESVISVTNDDDNEHLFCFVFFEQKFFKKKL